MTLIAGSKLGPYEIVAPLGAGGIAPATRGLGATWRSRFCFLNFLRILVRQGVKNRRAARYTVTVLAANLRFLNSSAWYSRICWGPDGLDDAGSVARNLPLSGCNCLW